MSTQRYISTSFWDDAFIQTLDPSEKLLYMYYMTSPLTNIAGIYKITESRISFDTGFTVDCIRHIMEKFEESGKAFRHGEYIILTKWTKHQKVGEKDNNRKGIDKILLALPDEVFFYALHKGYIYIYLKELGRPLQDPSMPLNYINLNINLNLNCNSNTKPCKPVKTTRAKKEFIPPTLEQVEEYVIEKQLVINPYRFMDWYTKTDWKDNEGKQVNNWKNKLINWDSREKEKNPKSVHYSKPLALRQSYARRCKHIDSLGNQCDGEIFNSYCSKCGAIYDGEDNEII